MSISISKYKHLLLDLMHEIGTLNHAIKSSSEILSKSTRGNIDFDNIVYHSHVIFDNSYRLALWLDMIRIDLFSESITQERMETRSLYGKFYKSAISFRRIGKNKKIKINIDGENTTCIDAYSIIDILPYIILDNSVKYSPPHGSVRIVFGETKSNIHIDISSFGPEIKDGEEEKIFDHGYRGQLSVASGIEGYGKGLYFARRICEMHDAKIKYIKPERPPILFDGIEYNEFNLRIIFPKN